MGNEFFQYLNSIFNKNRPRNFDIKNIPRVLLLHYLAHEKDLIDDVNLINKNLWAIPDNCVYEYFYNKIPKCRRFIKWTKKDSFKKSKELQEQIDRLKLKYNLSDREINELLDMEETFENK